MTVHELAVFNLTSQELESLDTGDIARFLGSLQLDSGTANGVAYLNASKVLTTGSGLQFDPASLGLTVAAGSGNTRRLGFDTSGVFYNWIQSEGASAGAATLSFAVSNTKTLYLTTTGLGIKYATPGDFTSVYASDLVVGDGAANAGMTIYGAAAGYSSIAFADGTGVLDQYAGLIQYSHITNAMNFFTNATLKMVLDASGNLGLGVTPSAWSGSVKALESAAGSVFSYLTSELHFSQNAYFATGDTWKYKANGAASDYSQITGVHIFSTAVGGTAGGAITFTEKARIDSTGLGISGNLSLSASATFPTTGMFLRSATNQLIFTGGSAGFLFGAESGASTFAALDNTGLGILTGTLQSGYQLTVGGGSASTNGLISLNGATTNDYGSGIAFRRGGTSKGFIGTQSWVVSGASDDITIYAAAGSALRFYSNGADVGRWDTGGGLLVGRTSSAFHFDVAAVDGNIASFAYDGSNSVLEISSPTTNKIRLWAGSGDILALGSANDDLTIDTSGNLIQKLNASAPTLTVNSTMTFELTSNTSLTVKVRGSDGTTRSVALTLA